LGYFFRKDPGDFMIKADRNLKLTIAYEGTRYAGFQRQENALTIQAVLEEAILKLTGETVTIIAAGRTDAGVHARGQVVNFHSKTGLPVSQIQKALNHFLPEDIVAQVVDDAPFDFQARFWAKSKTYSYRIYHSELRPVFDRKFVYHYRFPLKIELMREAAQFLVGTKDFRGFQAAGSSVKKTVKTVHFCEVSKHNSEIRVEMNADGFLYHMVRNIVGTLILVGNERMTIAGFKEVLSSGDRSLAGPTAPAAGLCLEEVIY
jgi:tRNA pseudouridine38-40 synthase